MSSGRAFGGWLAVGVLTGLAGWVRVETVFVIAFVVLAAVSFGRPRASIGWLVVAAAVAASVLLPWPLRHARVLDSFTLSTSAAANTFAGANCPSTWSGPKLGYWDFECTKVRGDLSEVEGAAQLMERAADHVGREWRRAPLVTGARVLRVWGLWRPWQQTRFDSVEQRHLVWQRIAWATGLVLAGLSVLAVVRGTGDRRGDWLRAIIVGSVLATCLIAAAFYGNQRFRAPVEPILCIAGGAAIARLRPQPSSCVEPATSTV